MRKPTITVKPYHRSLKYKFILDLRAFKKGRKFFKTRAEAEAEAFRQRTLLERHSREAVGMSQREMSEVIHARKTLAEFGETISDAVKFRVDYLERVRRHGITVSELTKEVLEAKRSDGLSAHYLGMLGHYFKRFCRDFGNRAIVGITVEELDNWLRSLPVSPKTRENYRTNIGVAFSHAERRRIIDHNPIRYTAKPKLIDRPPEIFSVDELRSLLEAATRTAPDVVPMLAIGAFAGLRNAEIKRLEWEEVDLVRGHIEVKAAKAKSARRRFVQIQPNLAAWLQPYTGLTGHVVPPGERDRLSAVRAAAGLARWPKNGLRHSFASYHLERFKNQNALALEMGHTNSMMIFNHYRELVLPEEADRYWKIGPSVEAEKVVAFRQSSSP
jgi:integrase